jgi:hypothetical protein
MRSVWRLDPNEFLHSTVIWLHEELAGALRAHRLATATTADAIFPAMPSMYRLKAHLCAARIPYIDD